MYKTYKICACTHYEHTPYFKKLRLCILITVLRRVHTYISLYGIRADGMEGMSVRRSPLKPYIIICWKVWLVGVKYN